MATAHKTDAQGSAAADHSAHTHSSEPSLSANKELVQRFWRAFSESRFDEALDCLAPDATWTVAGNTHISGTYSKSEFAALVAGISEETEKGIAVTPSSLTAEDNRVAMEAVSFGPLKNGRVYQNTYHVMHEVRGDKLSAVREYMDTEHVTAIFGP